jgi:hypothetical protein
MLPAGFYSRYALLLAGTAIGGWLGIRLQFGLQIAPYLTEEFTLFGIALIASAVLVTLLTPTSRLLERKLGTHVTAAVSTVAVLLSIAVGLLVYVGFLHRPFALVLERDWPYVLCFGLGGVGYALSYALQRRI